MSLIVIRIGILALGYRSPKYYIRILFLVNPYCSLKNGK